MAIKWSERQKQAIDTTGKNILVSASAGSGKTAVLSERIVNLVLDRHINIDKFVVVTFTRLAASEMKTRIAKKLNERKDNSDLNLSDSDKDFIDEQIILLEKANISTLDSFNVSLLRDYFYLANIEPNFKIIDEADNMIISSDVFIKLFNKYYESRDERFITLLKIYSSEKNDEGLKRVIKSLYDYIMNTPDPDKALNNILLNYNEDIDSSLYYKYFKEYFTKMLNEFITCYDSFFSVHPLLNDEYNFMKTLKEASDSYEKLYLALSSYDFETLRFKKDQASDDQKEYIKSIRNPFKEFIKDIKDKYLSNSKELFIKQINEIKPNLEMLVNLTREYKDMISDVKHKNNTYDFNDIAHLVISLLSKDGEKSDIAKSLTKEFEYIIVDEYQDVNDVQETILNLISRAGDEANVFMVGDVKQSIYGFRNADSDIFTNKYNKYKNGVSDSIKIDLNQNFRSRSEVLDSINYIFSKIMRSDIGGIEYDDEMALKYGEGYIDNESNNKTELVLLNKIKDLKNDIDENTLDDETKQLIEETKDNKLQALFIADEIEKLMTSYKVMEETKEGKTLRKLEYKDIAILFRGLQDNSKEVYKELKRRNIPVVITKQDNFMDELDVKETISILKTIDNPYDNISFVETMYSDLYKFTPNELMTLKNRNKYLVSFYQMIEDEYKVIKGIKEKLIDKENLVLSNITISKIKNVYETYNHLKDYYKKHTLEELIKEIYDIFNKEKYFLSFMNMKQKVDNMNLFLTYAKNFEKNGSRNIYDFIKQINDIEKTKKKIDMKMPVESSNAVTIMTIHKSKGLEYPVVFMPSLEKKMNKDDVKVKVLIEKELGYAAKYINHEKAYQRTNLFYEVAKEKIEEELIAEEMRIYYVAMTRAKEKLYLIGSYNEEKLDKYNNQMGDNDLVRYSTLVSANTPLDLMLPCIYSKEKESYEKLFEVRNETVDITTYDLKEKEELTMKSLWEEIMDNKNKNKNNDDNDNVIKDYNYTYADVSKIKQKVSVTEVKKRMIELLEEEEANNLVLINDIYDSDDNDNDENILEEKNIDDEKEIKKSYKAKSDILKKLTRKNRNELTGAEKGTIMHKLAKIISDTDVDKEFNRLIESNIFKKEELDQIDKEKIIMYLNSDTYNEVASSNFVKREMPFMMKKKAKEIYKDVTSDDEVIIQGIIDLLYEDKDGNLIILDYKTDKVNKKGITKEDRIKELVKHYKMQLDLYEEAVKLIYNRDIKEKVLYLFDSGDRVKIDD